MSADHHASNPDDLIIKRRNVLLIRGSREIDQQLEELFDRDVWKLSYAHENATALELATAEAFDLIVTSARTTGGEDVELLRRLRMVRPHTRLIILWLANCYFAHNSLRFSALLTFFNASSPSRGKHDGR